MADKKIIFLIGLLLIIASALGFLLIERDLGIKSQTHNLEVRTIKPTNNNNKQSKEKVNHLKKIDFYTDSDYDIPLSSVVETAEISGEIRNKINRILELSQGCYFIKRNSSKNIHIFLKNPVTDLSERYLRHNLQIADIDENGNVSYKDIGYIGEYGEISNAVVSVKDDDWFFDETAEPKRPLKHIAYDGKKIRYSEYWNYDEAEPIKYEMKNAGGETVSVMKESVTGDSGLKQEHVFYDENGNITKSMTVNYDGADIVWFTYYDSALPEDSLTIESVYNDGVKTEEKIYNQSYQLVKRITPKYADGNLNAMYVYDPDGNEIDAFAPNK